VKSKSNCTVAKTSTKRLKAWTERYIIRVGKSPRLASCHGSILPEPLRAITSATTGAAHESSLPDGHAAVRSPEFVAVFNGRRIITSSES
jgi:hypothetical protein